MVFVTAFTYFLLLTSYYSDRLVLILSVNDNDYCQSYLYSSRLLNMIHRLDMLDNERGSWKSSISSLKTNCS